MDNSNTDMKNNDSQQNIIERPPVVVVMGHIDHGKSTLLDYIRKSNIVAGEAGGITQHIAAYEIEHKDEKGTMKRITFLDTPGHEAFSQMRERGAQAADIAILVVSAEDSVKTQTLEAWNTIKQSGIPSIVAINKIDKPGANIERTKNDLTENSIYIEGFGGDIPFVEISAKQGTGIDRLLEIVLLVAELAELKGDPTIPAEGVIIEARLDVKRGISASLVIKNGMLKKGMYVLAGGALTTTRIMENFMGATIEQASFSSPIRLTGFSKLPEVGSIFKSYNTKKEAEQALENFTDGIVHNKKNIPAQKTSEEIKVVPIVIKTDVVGTAEAVEKEIMKLSGENIIPKIIGRGVGAISENDLKLASSDKEVIVLGFNVAIDSKARESNENLGVNIQTFDIIYKLTDWLKEEIEKRRPRVTAPEVTGKAKILKSFSSMKERQVIGGKVLEGILGVGANVKIMRRDFEIGQGRIIELQQQKIKTKEVAEGNDCGMLVETKTEIAPGDVLEAFVMVTK